MENKIIEVLDYGPSSFEDLGDGSGWGIYKVDVKMQDNSEKQGYLQGDTHNWVFETFEEYSE